MTMWLRQSTTVIVPFGPALDKTDGVTLETGLASAMDHASTGIRLSKNGAAKADRNDGTAPAYDAMGDYRITLNATDTGTLGTLRLIFEEAATCLPIWADFMVVPANVWDSLFGSDRLEVDLTHVGGSTTSVSALATNAAAILVDTGTTIPATITTIDNEIAVIDGIVDAILVDTGTTIPATITTIDNEIAVIDGIVDAVVADTNELQADWVNGGRLDLILDTAAAGGGDATEAKQDTIIANLATVDGIVDAILVDTGTTIPATITTIDNEIAVVDGVVDAILVDTGTTIPATITTIDNEIAVIDGVVDAIVADTNELQTDNVPGLIAALNNAAAVSVSDILTTQMTEAYAADGAAPTLAQALHQIWAVLAERSISGTTLTVKKLDGTATAMTFTLDSGTTPTTQTRAT